MKNFLWVIINGQENISIGSVMDVGPGSFEGVCLQLLCVVHLAVLSLF